MADNVVEIVVKSRDDTRKGFEEAKLGAERAGFEAGKRYQAGVAAGAASSAAGGGGGGGPYGLLAGIVAALPAVPALGAIAGASFVDAIGAAILIGTSKNRGPIYDAFKDFTGVASRTMQQAVQPMAQPLREAFRSLGGFARSLGPELTTLFTAAGKSIYPFTKGLEALIAGVLPGLITLLKAGRPAFRAFGDVLGDIGKGLGGFLAALAPAVRPAALYVADFGKVLALLLPAAGRLLAALAPLGPQFGILAIALAKLLIALIPLIPPLTTLAVALMPVVIKVVTLLTQVLNLLVPPIAKVAQQVANAILWFIKWNESAYRVYAAMAALGAWLSRVWNDIVNGAQSMVGKVVSWFQGLPGRILSALGNIGGLLVNAGKSIISGLIAGVQSMMGPLGGVLSGITHLIPNLKGPPATDRMLLFGSGQMIMGGLMAGIGSQVPALRGQLAGVTAGIGATRPGIYGGGGVLRVEFAGGPGSGLDHLLWGWVQRNIRYTVNVAGGGNVQAAFGSAS